MRKRMILGITAVLIVCFFTVGRGHGETRQEHLSFAVLPCSDVVMSYKKFHPLIEYLKIQTGLDVELLVPKDAQEFEWTIKNRDVDYVLQDPHTYVGMAGLYKRNALLRTLTKDGNTFQYGLFVVRKDSGITGIKGLKGKTVMFGPTLSAAKWIEAKRLLKENGLNIDKDLKAYQHGGCCEDIVFNVYLKAVDAGAVCEHFVEGHTERQKELGIDVKDLMVIGKTRKIPNRVLAARKGLSDEIVNRVNSALLGLDRQNPAHNRILLPAEIGGFERARDRDYDDMRAVMGVGR